MKEYTEEDEERWREHMLEEEELVPFAIRSDCNCEACTYNKDEMLKWLADNPRPGLGSVSIFKFKTRPGRNR